MLTGFLPFETNEMIFLCQTKDVVIKNSPYLKEESTKDFLKGLLQFDVASFF